MDQNALALPDPIPEAGPASWSWQLSLSWGCAGGLGWGSPRQSFLGNQFALTPANVLPLPDPALPSFSAESYSHQQQGFVGPVQETSMLA